jgi:NADH-quinone oxidoreductase subunit I
MNYFENIIEGLSTTVGGMKITLDHLFSKKVTNQYPDSYHPITSGDMPLNSRNRLFVDMAGCDGCEQCDKACPINCITIETIKVTPDDPNIPEMNSGKKRKSWVSKHEIDFAKCCFCSLCTEVCPTNAIIMTQEFEYSEFDREKLKYNFSDMTNEQVIEKQTMWDDYQIAKKKEQEEKKRLDAEAKQAVEVAKIAVQSNPEVVVSAVPSPEELAKAQEIEANKIEAEKKKAERMAAKEAGSVENKTE